MTKLLKRVIVSQTGDRTVTDQICSSINIPSFYPADGTATTPTTFNTSNDVYISEKRTVIPDVHIALYHRYC